jgi:hypothetical protein
MAWGKSNFYLRYLKTITKIPSLFILVDFITGAYRNYFREIIPFGIVKQSEHINYFSGNAVKKLLETQLDSVYISGENLAEKYGHYRLGFLAAVARKK